MGSSAVFNFQNLFGLQPDVASSAEASRANGGSSLV